jgi:hypothetical protein
MRTDKQKNKQNARWQAGKIVGNENGDRDRQTLGGYICDIESKQTES